MSVVGSWRIVETELWDSDALNLVAPAFIEFGEDGMGSFGFIAVQGEMDCQEVTRDGLPGVEFSWEGNDDCDPASGPRPGGAGRGRVAARAHLLPPRRRFELHGSARGRADPVGVPGRALVEAVMMMRFPAGRRTRWSARSRRRFYPTPGGADVNVPARWSHCPVQAKVVKSEPALTLRNGAASGPTIAAWGLVGRSGSLEAGDHDEEGPRQSMVAGWLGTLGPGHQDRGRAVPAARCC